MLRWFINYLRSCFCKHDWEFLKEMRIFEDENAKMPSYTRATYRCKKCGYYQRIRF